MAFPPLKVAIIDAVDAQEMRIGTHGALRMTLVGQCSFHNGNIVANAPISGGELRCPQNLPNSASPELAGVRKCLTGLRNTF
jgi:hypothetical protein